MNGNLPFSAEDVPRMITETNIWKQVMFAFSASIPQKGGCGEKGLLSDI